MLLKIMHSCTDVSKGAASPATPLFIMGALACGSWVGFPPGLLLCHLLFPLPLDGSSWETVGVHYLV